MQTDNTTIAALRVIRNLDMITRSARTLPVLPIELEGFGITGGGTGEVEIVVDDFFSLPC